MAGILSGVGILSGQGILSGVGVLSGAGVLGGGGVDPEPPEGFVILRQPDETPITQPNSQNIYTPLP